MTLPAEERAGYRRITASMRLHFPSFGSIGCFLPRSQPYRKVGNRMFPF
jgi:hypothetical protein